MILPNNLSALTSTASISNSPSYSASFQSPVFSQMDDLASSPLHNEAYPSPADIGFSFHFNQRISELELPSAISAGEGITSIARMSTGEIRALGTNVYQRPKDQETIDKHSSLASRAQNLYVYNSPSQGPEDARIKYFEAIAPFTVKAEKAWFFVKSPSSMSRETQWLRIYPFSETVIEQVYSQIYTRYNPSHPFTQDEAKRLDQTKNAQRLYGLLNWRETLGSNARIEQFINATNYKSMAERGERFTINSLPSLKLGLKSIATIFSERETRDAITEFFPDLRSTDKIDRFLSARTQEPMSLDRAVSILGVPPASLKLALTIIGESFLEFPHFGLADTNTTRGFSSIAFIKNVVGIYDRGLMSRTIMGEPPVVPDIELNLSVSRGEFVVEPTAIYKGESTILAKEPMTRIITEHGLCLDGTTPLISPNDLEEHHIKLGNSEDENAKALLAFFWDNPFKKLKLVAGAIALPQSTIPLKPALKDLIEQNKLINSSGERVFYTGHSHLLFDVASSPL